MAWPPSRGSLRNPDDLFTFARQSSQLLPLFLSPLAALAGFSAAISVLDLVNLKAQDNAARGVPNTTPGLSPAGSIDPDWGLNATIADQLSLSNLLYSLSGSMTLFHTFPTTTLSGIGQEINQTRIQMYGAPFTDRNVELNIVDLCLTATDAIRRMSADRALCVEDSVSTRGRTFLNYLLKTNTPGVAEQLTYSTKSQDLQVPQGVFNLLTSEDDNNVPQYNVSPPFAFCGALRSLLFLSDRMIFSNGICKPHREGRL